MHVQTLLEMHLHWSKYASFCACKIGSYQSFWCSEDASHCNVSFKYPQVTTYVLVEKINFALGTLIWRPVGVR